MPELDFFYSANDPSVAQEALRLGNHLLVGDDYEPDQELILLSPGSSADLRLYRRFYVLPDPAFVSEIEVWEGIKTRTGKKFRYIPDRIGAAAIDLILHDRPAEGEVCVGSLGFQYRTYPSSGEPLEVRPKVFHDAFNKLASFIKRSAQRVPNRKTPLIVYVFPDAMELIREDFSRSPWPSVEIPD